MLWLAAARVGAQGVAAEGGVALQDVLRYADRRSPVLTVARATRSRADAARVAAQLLLPSNPELSVAVGPSFGSGNTGVDLELGLMQELETGGERSARIDAAHKLRELTEAEIERLRWEVRCDVRLSFFTALMERERAQLAASVLAFQQDVLRVVERQIAAGEAAPLAVRLAEAEVAQAQQMSTASEQSWLASRLRLAQQAGWPTATPPLPAGALAAPRDPRTAAELVKLAREHLPSLRAAAARVREAGARVSLADREGWPRPSVGVQYQHDADGPRDTVMGVLSVPIPGFRRNQGGRADARADAAIAQAELAAAQQLLESQIALARSEVVAAAQRTRAYGTAILPRFEENLRLLARSLELGEIDILAFATGRERFLRIQSDALAAQLDYYLALANLERIVGSEVLTP
ncbi:MAG TPA: TolC family protein [Polyangiales bacterium]|nr:TolC family protein [Polyangiales bacterium]